MSLLLRCNKMSHSPDVVPNTQESNFEIFCEILLRVLFSLGRPFDAALELALGRLGPA